MLRAFRLMPGIPLCVQVAVLSAGFLLSHCPHRMLTLLLPGKTVLNAAMHLTFSSLPAVSLRSGCWKLSASPPALVLPPEASCELQET